MCTAQKEKERVCPIQTKDHSFLLLFSLFFFFHDRFFKQKEKSLITKILKMWISASGELKC